MSEASCDLGVGGSCKLGEDEDRFGDFCAFGYFGPLGLWAGVAPPRELY